MLVLGAGCTSAASQTPDPTLTAQHSASAPAQLQLELDQAESLLCEVLESYDRDCDTRITREDWAACADGCDTSSHPVTLPNGETLILEHRYQVSQLAQELALQLHSAEQDSTQQDSGPEGTADIITVDMSRVRASPAQTLAWRIENVYWDSLTRRIDREPAALVSAATDGKLNPAASVARELCSRSCGARPPEPTSEQPEAPLHVYVPASDPVSLAGFADLDLSGQVMVHALPPKPGPAFVHELTRRGAHGLLTLGLDEAGRGRPFVVPGGRFNEMYGWDSYFIALGLLESPDYLELARAMVDNLVYEIEHYGKILNANRTYYLTRSQPPLLTSMILEVDRRSTPGARTAQWTSHAMMAAMIEYETVWAAPPRRSEVCQREVCLARYFGQGAGEPPEVEAGHFDWFYQHYASSSGRCHGRDGSPEQQRQFAECARRLAEDYRTGDLTDERIDTFFTHDRCMRESGHDTTYRWFGEGPIPERCADFVTVDLNALLLKYELDFAAWHRSGVALDTAGRGTQYWCQRARARAELMRRHLYDPATGLFFDYDTTRGRRSSYVSATTLYPLWAAGPNVCGLTLLERSEQERLVAEALRQLEQPGGLSATSAESLRRVEVPQVIKLEGAGVQKLPLSRQWEYPNGWAPHQMIAWQALLQSGFGEEAQRLIYKWLYTIVHNAAGYHGTVPEKFDVVRRTHQVFEEYGNVNTDFRYIATEGFGWMNASYVVGWRQLDPALRGRLAARGGPEDLYGGNAPEAGRQPAGSP